MEFVINVNFLMDLEYFILLMTSSINDNEQQIFEILISCNVLILFVMINFSASNELSGQGTSISNFINLKLKKEDSVSSFNNDSLIKHYSLQIIVSAVKFSNIEKQKAKMSLKTTDLA